MSSEETTKMTLPSDQEHSSKSSNTSSKPTPRSPAQAAEENHTPPNTRPLSFSSPVQPFPELDPDLEAELAQLSPRFSHDTGTHGSPAALSLPTPAVDRRKLDRKQPKETSAVVHLCVQWVEENEDSEEGGMKEATRRQLEWARKMFKKDPERDEKQSDRVKADGAAAK